MNSLRKKDVLNLEHKFNEETVNGMAVNMSDEIMPYLDRLYRSFTKKIDVGLDYNGYTILSPWDYASMVTNQKQASRRYDVVETSHIYVRLHATYMGEEVPNTIISIPYIKSDGQLVLSDIDYTVIPVLSDTLISPTATGVLLGILISKVSIDSITRPFMKNDELVISPIVYSKDFLWATITGNELGTGIVNPLYLYLMAINGVKDYFTSITNSDMVLDVDDNIELYKETHNIYRPLPNKPIGLFKDAYMPSSVIICIKKDVVTQEAEDMVYSLLYVMSIFPELSITFINTINNGDKEREKQFIYYIMARLVYLDTYDTGEGTTLIINHIASLDRYIDPISVERASEINLDITTPSKLIAVLVNNFKEWNIAGKGYSSNLEQRYIEIFYYLLYDYVVGMNRILIDIDKNKGVKMLMTRIKRMFTMHLSSKVIYSLTSGGGVNICLKYIDTVGDSRFVRDHSVLELKERAAGVKKGKSQQFPASIRKVVPLDTVLGTLNNLPKQSPSPRVSLNAYCRFDPNGRIMVLPKDIIKMKKLEYLLNGRNTSYSKDLMMLMTNSSNDLEAIDDDL